MLLECEPVRCWLSENVRLSTHSGGGDVKVQRDENLSQPLEKWGEDGVEEEHQRFREEGEHPLAELGQIVWAQLAAVVGVAASANEGLERGARQ